MAIDKLVDSTKLNSALSATADAIRAKSGDTADIPFDMESATGFESAIEAIPAGENKLQKLLANQPFTITAEDFAGATEVRDHQFDGVSNMQGELVLPDTITSIGYSGFEGTAITKITTPINCNSLGQRCFYNCAELVLINILGKIGSLSNEFAKYCGKLQDITFAYPDLITSFGSSCFSGCDLLTFDFPQNINSIAAYTFYQNKHLTTLTFPPLLTTIGQGTCEGCTNLEAVTFTATPNSLAANTFRYCTNLTQINCPWAEGEVANAPWGATNATITYNYTPSEGGNS